MRGWYRLTFYHNHTARAVFTNLNGDVIATADAAWAVRPAAGDHFVLNFAGSPVLNPCAWVGPNRFVMFTEDDVWLTFDHD